MIVNISINSGETKEVGVEPTQMFNALTFWAKNLESMTVGWDVKLYYGPKLVDSVSFSTGYNLYKYHDQSHFPPYFSRAEGYGFETEFKISIKNNDMVTRTFRVAIV